MSEQGEMLTWEEWVNEMYMPFYAKRIFDGELAREEALLKYRIYKLVRRLTTAETAATEYAQQAAELQEEVGRLRSLWIEYRNATDEDSSYSVLAELFKRFDDAIRGTE